MVLEMSFSSFLTDSLTRTFILTSLLIFPVGVVWGYLLSQTFTTILICHPNVKQNFHVGLFIFAETFMNIFVSKENRLNIRVKPDFKEDLKKIASYHGLTVSSYVHSVLVKTIRLEKEAQPDAFRDMPRGKTPLSNVPVIQGSEDAENIDDKGEIGKSAAADLPTIVISSDEDFKKFSQQQLDEQEKKKKK